MSGKQTSMTDFFSVRRNGIPNEHLKKQIRAREHDSHAKDATGYKTICNRRSSRKRQLEDHHDVRTPLKRKKASHGTVREATDETVLPAKESIGSPVQSEDPGRKDVLDPSFITPTKCSGRTEENGQEKMPILPSPSLSRDKFTFDITYTSPKKSTGDQTPRNLSSVPAATSNQLRTLPKKLDFGVSLTGLPQPSPGQPLPVKYKTLAEQFKTLDHIVSLQYNRGQRIVMDNLIVAMQEPGRSHRWKFTSDQLMKILSVFPQAYTLAWERKVDKCGKKMKDHELCLFPCNHKNNDRLLAQMDIKLLFERQRIFKYLLLQKVMDQHKLFHKVRGIDTANKTSVKWHTDFDLEACPDIEKTQIPPKPVVSQFKATECIEAINQAFAGSYQGSASKTVDKSICNDGEHPTTKQIEADDFSMVKVSPKLRGLPKSLIERVLAKEKKAKDRMMRENSEDTRDRIILSDLIKFAPMLFNCYRSMCDGPIRRALVPADFYAFVAKSDGNKSIREVKDLVNHFIKVAPEYFILCEKYIRQKDDVELDHKRVKEKLTTLLEAQKQAAG